VANLDIVKSAIADGTKQLIREKTIDKITVTAICEKTGLNRRNFYRYFQDKYEVVDWIYFHDHIFVNERYEGWSFWDYFPRIAQSLYNDKRFYLNAFKDESQNCFRKYCINRLFEVLDPDFGRDFPSAELEHFYVEHVCNMAFDSFVIWLSAEPCMPPDEFVALFRQLFSKNAETQLRLLTRPPMERAEPKDYVPQEPAKK